MKKLCTIDNCESPAKSKNMCNKHYLRYWKYNDPLYVAKNVGHREYHGLRNTPEYKSWNMMKNRCNNSNLPEYRYYGGRGIKICEEWDRSFTAFLNDMGKRPRGTSLDRIDPNGNYEPSNCRWADRYTQATNKRQMITNTSGQTGVYYRKDTNKWQARIESKGKRYSLGCYETLEQASKVYIEAKLIHH